jgi:two-component system, cell cycle response regulator
MKVAPQEIVRTLLTLTGELMTDHPLQTYLGQVTDAAMVLVAADHASIRLLDEGGTRLLSSARSGSGQSRPAPELRAGQGVAGWVVDNGTAAFIRDVREDSRFQAYADQPYEIRSMIVAPLLTGREVIGVLSVTSPEVAAFDDAELTLVRLLANCATPAIDRARLNMLATYDQQTQAYAKHMLFPKIAEEIEVARRTREPLSLLSMDLDHFKRINDSHGHAAGDEALSQFAKLVRTVIRRPDTFARRGGEEFVVILPNASLEQAERTASRIREKLEGSPLNLSPKGGSEISVNMTVSIGVATWTGSESPAEFESRADAAMYLAKKFGRNAVRTSYPPNPESSL